MKINLKIIVIKIIKISYKQKHKYLIKIDRKQY